MTDTKQSKSLSNASQRDEVEDAVVIDSQSDTQPTQKPVKTKALWFLSLINLLLIILIACGIYWYWMQIQHTQDQRQDDIAVLEGQVNNSLSSLGRSLSNVETALEEKSQTLSQSLDNIMAQVLENSEADSALERQISEISGRRPSDWLLAEANYLVNMAGRKLYLEQDVRTAITLLKEADARLHDLADPSLLPIRAQIAGDIQTLQQVNPVSTTSIALAISGLLPQVSQLPLENLKLPEDEREQEAELSNDVADWQDNLKSTWRAIVGDFISVKSVDEPLAPYLSERQQWLIEQQLKHALSQAQSAALDEHFTLYQTTLQQAMALIIEHYQIDTPAVNEFMKALQQLQSSNFEREYPSKLNSVDALKDALERRVERQFNNRPSEQGAANSDNQGNSL